MLVGADISGLVDQQHRDVVLDPVGLVKSGVIQPVADMEQGSPVRGAHQDVEHSRVEHDCQGVGAAGIAGAAAAAAGAPGLESPGIWPAPMTALLAP